MNQSIVDCFTPAQISLRFDHPTNRRFLPPGFAYTQTNQTHPRGTRTQTPIDSRDILGPSWRCSLSGAQTHENRPGLIAVPRRVVCRLMRRYRQERTRAAAGIAGRSSAIGQGDWQPFGGSLSTRATSSTNPTRPQGPHSKVNFRRGPFRRGKGHAHLATSSTTRRRQPGSRSKRTAVIMNVSPCSLTRSPTPGIRSLLFGAYRTSPVSPFMGSCPHE